MKFTHIIFQKNRQTKDVYDIMRKHSEESINERKSDLSVYRMW